MAAARGDAAGDVPDPYFGGAAGFEEMMDLLEEGCAAILKDLPPAGAAGRVTTGVAGVRCIGRCFLEKWAYNGCHA